MTLSAFFAIDTHTVTVMVDSIAHGSVSGGGRYTYGSVVTVTAAPYSGYQFSHWSNGATYNPYIFAVLDNTALTAIFISDGETYQDTIFLFDTLQVFVHDTTYLDIHDTTYINIHDTTYIDIHDAIYLPQYIYDTIYIHDTIVVGVDEVEAINAKIYTNRGQIVVEGAEGNNVWLYDVNGRLLATKRDEYTPLHFDVSVSGTYLIKIGNHRAHKVVVFR